MQFVNPESVQKTNGQYLVNNSDPSHGYLLSDGTYNRVLVGYDKGGFGTGNDIGIKVSQSGYDVLTAADSNLVMSSAFNNFKITAKVTQTITVAGAALYINYVYHSLGTIAAMAAFVKTPAGDTFAVPAMYFAIGTGVTIAAEANVQTYSNQFTLTVGIGSSSGSTYDGTWNFTIYILQETAAS